MIAYNENSVIFVIGLRGNLILFISRKSTRANHRDAFNIFFVYLVVKQNL